MNPLEQWCAEQIRRIAGDLLVPKLEFGSLQLELPVTVTLSDVSLTSGDVAIVTVSSMRLEFRERPKKGHPFVIAAATFVDPEVRLIGRSDGRLEGFAHFMKSTGGKQYQDGGSSNPSDFLAIRRLVIHSGRFEWAPSGYEHPMRFEQLEIDLTVNPDADRPGSYAFKANVERRPVVQLIWDGGINIDTGDLAFNDTTLRVNLAEDRYAALTPSVQKFMRQYAIVGDLTLHTTGHVSLDNAQSTDLAFGALLRNAGAAFGDYQFPIESAEIKATFRQMQLSYDALSVSAFGGKIDSIGSLSFADRKPFTLQVTAKDVLIQDILRPDESKESAFAGKIGLDLEAAGKQRDLGATLKGTGVLMITEGLLINIPVIGALADYLKIGKPGGHGNDRGEIDFILVGDRVKIEKSSIQSAVAAARATGDIHYDGQLDLMVNAGAVEKAQVLLGELGNVLGRLTDHLLPYKVTGSWSKPIVTPKPFGVSFDKLRGVGKKTRTTDRFE